MNTYTEMNMPVRDLKIQEYDELDSSSQYDWEDESYNDDRDLEQDIDDYESSDESSSNLSETRFDNLSDDLSTQNLPSTYNPNHVFHLVSLTSGESIPMNIVRAHSSWEDASAAYKALQEEQKKIDEMSEFVNFNKKTEEAASKEVDRLFMEALPTMSKAYKERLMKEKEAKQKGRASDQFYNIGRPSATSHTAWGHKTGGKNKGLSMKDAGSEKVALEIAALRKARRAASKIKKDEEEKERAEKFKEMEERKKILQEEEKAKMPEVPQVVMTEEQIEFKKFQEDTIKCFIKKQLEVLEKEEVKEVPQVDSDDDDDDIQYLVSSLLKKKQSIAKTAIAKPIIVTPTVTRVNKPLVVPTVLPTKVDSRAICKFFSEGQVCRHGDKCRFLHKTIAPVTELVTTKVGRKNIAPIELQFCMRVPEKSRFAWDKPLILNPRFVPKSTPIPQPISQPIPQPIPQSTREPRAVTPQPIPQPIPQSIPQSVPPISVPVCAPVVCVPIEQVESTRSEALNVLADNDKIREKLSFTRMCISVSTGKPCRHGTNCRFAHSKKELKIAPCFFGDRCKFVCMKNGKYVNMKDKNCTNLHPNESENDFHIRTQQKTGK